MLTQLISGNFLETATHLTANQYITKTPMITTVWISKFLGFFLNIIYNFVSIFGTANSLGFAIVLFTIFVRLLMLPLAFKQQHSMTKMQIVQPEVAKVQKKYKDKKDTESQRKMQAEVQALYAKHGVSPLSGCLPLVIQMPIFFTLSYMMNNVHLFIGKIDAIYQTMLVSIESIPGWDETLRILASTKFRPADIGKIKLDLSGVAGDANARHILSKLLPNDWNVLLSNAPTEVSTTVTDSINQLESIQHFFGIDLTQTPGLNFSIALLIPLLAVLTSVASSYLMLKITPAQTGQAAQQQKMMMYIMPLVMGVTTINISAGVGVYWITSSMFQTAQQYFVNKSVKKTLGIDSHGNNTTAVIEGKSKEKNKK